MGITAERLLRLQLVDEVIPEPLGGAHRDPQAMADALKAALMQHARARSQVMPLEALLAQRRRRLAEYGVFKET